MRKTVKQEGDEEKCDTQEGGRGGGVAEERSARCLIYADLSQGLSGRPP